MVHPSLRELLPHLLLFSLISSHPIKHWCRVNFVVLILSIVSWLAIQHFGLLPNFSVIFLDSYCHHFQTQDSNIDYFYCDTVTCQFPITSIRYSASAYSSLLSPLVEARRLIYDSHLSIHLNIPTARPLLLSPLSLLIRPPLLS